VIHIAAMFALLASFAVPAAAPVACADRDEAFAHLEARYGERAVADGLASNGGHLEILVSPDRSTWSIVVTMPNGFTCLIASGEAWEPAPARRRDGGA
jgi:hypothetical protein